MNEEQKQRAIEATRRALTTPDHQRWYLDPHIARSIQQTSQEHHLYAADRHNHAATEANLWGRPEDARLHAEASIEHMKLVPNFVKAAYTASTKAETATIDSPHRESRELGIGTSYPAMLAKQYSTGEHPHTHIVGEVDHKAAEKQHRIAASIHSEVQQRKKISKSEKAQHRSAEQAHLIAAEVHRVAHQYPKIHHMPLEIAADYLQDKDEPDELTNHLREQAPKYHSKSTGGYAEWLLK